MRSKKLFAALLTVVMVIGTMSMSVPAYAEGNSGNTKVKLMLMEENQYTMTIPATTIMNSDGSATALTNGLNVKGTNMTKDVVVTITGADDWKMSATGVSTRIGYAVYDAESCDVTDQVFEVEFSRTEVEANSGAGTTKALYIKPDATDLEAADAGDYEGTITFTANLKGHAPSLADVLVTGAKCKLSLWVPSQNCVYEFTYKKTETGFESEKAMRGDEDVSSSFAGKYLAAVEDNNAIKLEFLDAYAPFDVTINISTSTYSFHGNSGGAEFREFAVQPIGTTEFTALDLTCID